MNNIIAKEFSSLQRIYDLKSVFFDDADALFIASDFCLLVWCDREGATVNYVDLKDISNPLRSFNLGNYLAINRKWHSTPRSNEDHPSRIVQSLASIAKTIEYEADDIMKGARPWRAKPNISFSPLSEWMELHIRSAIDR